MRERHSQAEKGLWKADRLSVERLPSTNQEALDRLKDLNHGDIIYTLNQQKGRGRQQRSWVAPPGRGLTFSIVLLDVPPEHSPAISLAAALAVRAMLDQNGIPAKVKWPNDVLVNDRKICGILAESKNITEGLVLGIGLNVNISPSELKASGVLAPAISMLDYTGNEHDIESVFDELRRHLELRLQTVISSGFEPLAAEWKRYDSLIGCEISLQLTDTPVSGVYEGLSSTGQLILKIKNEPHYFWSGDVTKINQSS